MKRYKYYSGGRQETINLQSILPTSGRAIAPTKVKSKVGPSTPPSPVTPRAAKGEIVSTLSSQKTRLDSRFTGPSESTMSWSVPAASTTVLIPTETVVVDGARVAELKWMQKKYGMKEVQEGRRGKVLMQVPPDADDRVAVAFESANELFKRGVVGAAHPNFLRAIQRPAASSEKASVQWGLDNPGKPGVVGADVHAHAAWTITEGSGDIRVAVLDEGVDTLHPYLKDAIVTEKDFVDNRLHARPSGNDAHGTACAGIIVSQRDKIRGLAPGVRIIAVRIAKSNAQGFWIFDDFDTADAIDWAWEEAKADVLSCSWSGGPPVDVIIRAFERARTLGRRKKGTVVVVAAGNRQKIIGFPGNLPGILTVGASNQWDERKTKGSRDNEKTWGSNYGDGLDLLAPGVGIITTDIHGNRGYTGGNIRRDFNGTSAATPFVAATAGMILSINPKLTEKRVREIINENADKLTKKGKKDRYRGHGRLNVYSALRAARRQ